MPFLKNLIMSWIDEILDMEKVLRETALQPVSEADLSLGSFPESEKFCLHPVCHGQGEEFYPTVILKHFSYLSTLKI